MGRSAHRQVGPAAPGAALSRGGRKCGTLLCSLELEEGHFAWATLDKTLEPGTPLDGDSTLIDFA